MNYGKDATDSHLTSGLHHSDSPGRLDGSQGDDNTGLKIRRELTAESGEVDMTGRLHTDIMHQGPVSWRPTTVK